MSLGRGIPLHFHSPPPSSLLFDGMRYATSITARTKTAPKARLANSHIIAHHLLKFPLHTTITSSLNSAAEASPQSYYWGEGFAKSVLQHQLHLLPRTRAIPASPDHFKQNNQTKSQTNLICAISATNASSSPDASFDRTREPKRTYKILRFLRPSNRVCTLPDTRSPPPYAVFCVDVHFVSYVGHWVLMREGRPIINV